MTQVQILPNKITLILAFILGLAYPNIHKILSILHFLIGRSFLIVKKIITQGCIKMVTKDKT